MQGNERAAYEGIVRIAEYSPQWPAVFAAEAEVIRSVFLPAEVHIEHVGSTAVPGLVAKPIIDILLGASSLPEIEHRIPALEAIGYSYVPEFEKQLPLRRYFSKPDRRDGRFHLHAVEHGSAFWHEQLRFRDALRAQPALRDEYARLKRRLAVTHNLDRAAYTDAKAPFIQRVLRERQRET